MHNKKTVWANKPEAMRRSTVRNSKKSVRVEPKHFAPERLAERVFVESPRTFSFSHRQPGSLRHPYLSLVVDLVECIPAHKRVESILEALLDAKDEGGKWQRVGAIFDSKIEAPEIDKRRMEILTSPEVMSKIESLWSLLGGTQGSFLTVDIYRRFHALMYAVILGSDDVSLTAATITTVNEDYAYDARDFAGVSYGSFALSMLEIADNWTKSRNPADYAAFLQSLVEAHDPTMRCFTSVCQTAAVATTDFSLSDNVFFSGGLLVKHQVENHVQYTKIPM